MASLMECQKDLKLCRAGLSLNNQGSQPKAEKIFAGSALAQRLSPCPTTERQQQQKTGDNDKSHSGLHQGGKLKTTHVKVAKQTTDSGEQAKQHPSQTDYSSQE